MKKNIRNFIQTCTPKKLKDFFYYNHPEYKKNINGIMSFSSEGEDMVLNRIYGSQEKGFYVDIGAHHPNVYSNTRYFYQKGWTGINIEPIPGAKAIFDQERPNDINLEVLVSESDGVVEFYLFDPPLMNTMSKKQLEENQKFEWCKYKETVLVKSVPLSRILDQYIPPGKAIDFMSIDVEGAEMTVLQSNNWEKYAPDVLLVELINISYEGIGKHEVHRFLDGRNYNFYGKTGNTLVYKKKGFFEF